MPAYIRATGEKLFSTPHTSPQQLFIYLFSFLYISLQPKGFTQAPLPVPDMTGSFLQPEMTAMLSNSLKFF
jgi:hypothetical protein